jgi:NAD(P)-dependent dehydrogenase (short-subunit alcohol dehydrogenase family)
MKKVVITGTSSGIGRSAVLAFAEAGWSVVATMRDPSRETELQGHPNVCVMALDVTVAASIESAMKEIGPFDVLVNNAGYGLDGAFEETSEAAIRQQFETNVFGLMAMTRAAIPVLRDRKGGAIVQIASMGGRLAFPYFSAYHSSKWAVEGFSESLQYELRQFGIRVKIVEPGAIKTEFYGRGRKKAESSIGLYEEGLKQAELVSQGAGKRGISPEVVARVIVKASQDRSNRLRFVVGAPAPLMLAIKKLLPEKVFFAVVRSAYRVRP